MAENKFKIKNGLDVQGAATLGSTLNVTGAITGNVTGQVSDISNHSTTQLSEGTNLYYTTARATTDARAALSVNDNAGDGALTYNSTTGVFDYSGISDTQVRSKISVTDAGGDGSLAYNSASGVITYTGPSATEVRAHLSATDAGGDGSFAYNSSTGVFTYTGPSAAETQAHFQAGNLINYDSAAGRFSADSGEIKALVSASDAGGDGSFSYNSSTGVFTYTGPSASEVRAHLSVTDNGGDGSLSYDNGTGVISYTGPSAAEVRAHFSGGTGVTITNGEVAIGQAVATTSDVTFANVTISGNLQVNGTETIVSVDALSVSDALIHLADSNETSDTVDIGIVAHYSPDAGTTKQHTGFFRDANNGEWYVFGEYVATGLDGAPYDTTINRGDASFELAPLNASFLSGKYRGFDSDFTAKSTTNLSEGTNLYYTTARANTDFDTRLATKSTTNLSEGTNLYYTTTRATNDARAAVSATDAGGDGSFSYNSGTGVFTYTGPSAAEVRAHLTANKGLSVTNGEFNIDSANVRGMFAGGSGLTYTLGTGTFNVGAGNGITVNADDVALASTTGGAGLTFTTGVLAVGAGNGITVNADDVALAASTAGAGLTYTTGVLAVGQGTGIIVNADTIQLAGTVAGAGMTHTTGVLDLVAADSGGIVVNADSFGVNNTVVRTNGAQTIYGAKTIASPLTVANNTGINLDYASGTDSKLFRATGGATQFEYYDNSFIFDAKGNHAFQVRNSGAAATLTHTPNSTVTSSTTTIEGSVDITGNMNASSVEVDGIYTINSGSASTSSTTQTAIFTFPKATIRSGKFFVQITNTTDTTYHSVECMILHDGTTADLLEYGTIFTGAAVEATFEADISGNDVRLLATPASADSMTFKVMANLLEV